jgi:hypothetical protein
MFQFLAKFSPQQPVALTIPEGAIGATSFQNPISLSILFWQSILQGALVRQTNDFATIKILLLMRV